MPVKGKCLRKVKASRMMEKVASLNGVHLVMIIGTPEGAPRVTIVLIIIQGSSQADVQSADRLVILPHSVLVQLSPKQRMLNGKSPHGPMRMKSGMVLNGSLKSMKRQRAKEKDLSLKRSPRARMHRDLSLRSLRSLHRRRATDPNPEARSCMTSDFLFVMMSTKPKPTWRQSTWNGTDYMICTVVEPQKKLPVFREGKWSLVTDLRVSLYGLDVKTMKNFTLHFDKDDQCDTLDRAWFGEMWFPVQKHSYHVQSSVTHDCRADQKKILTKET